MTTDMNKGLSEIQYNHLNLPLKVVFDTDKYIEYTYDAAGTKLRKKVTNGANTHTTDYVYGLHITEGSMDFVPTTEGRYMFADNSYQYNLTDHLACLPKLQHRQGNVRVTLNQAGEVIQRDDYYPFGLTFNSYIEAPENLYKYNGKEEQKETGWFDYGARMYYPALMRWHVIDGLAMNYQSLSPYNYAINNPIRYIDILGLGPGDRVAKARKLVEWRNRSILTP